MTARLGDFRARWREEAARRGCDPRDVDVLIADAVGRSTAFVIAHGELDIAPEPLVAQFQRRFAGEPLQYIRRRADFYGREFYVDDRVLIPRPETELLVEAAIERAPRNGRVVDVGAGSGCVSISIERSRPDLRVFAVDRSCSALAVTKDNAQNLGSGIWIAASDFLSAISGTFDLIVSNPPYIRERDVEHLDRNVRDHEPRLALTPGPRGTEAIERIIDESKDRLRDGGRVMMEIGFDQEAEVRAIADAARFDVEAVIPDLAAIPRVVVLSKNGE